MKNDTDLYFIQAKNTGMIKIGRSKHPERRLKQLQTGNSDQLKLIAVFKGMGWRESYLHDYLRKWKVRSNGEWFHHDCVGSIPADLYEQIPYGSFDEWWQ